MGGWLNAKLPEMGPEMNTDGASEGTEQAEGD